jgi:hypothetical protein
MAGLIGSLVLQNIIINIVASLHPMGSSEGEAILKRFYAGATEDAVQRWNRQER